MHGHIVNFTLGLAILVSWTFSDTVAADKKSEWGAYQVEDRRSGYTWAQPETQAMQDDDFANPAMVLVDTGAELWNKVDGENGKSCASCHSDASKSMRGLATVYPKLDKKSGKLRAIEKQVNVCRTEQMKAKEWEWESTPMLSMTTYIRHQSRGMPVNPKVDGEYAQFFEMGKKFYYERRGLLDMSCANCHEDNAGNVIRANVLSQGQINGFPTYRLKWQKVGSVHRRFKGCNDQVRATPFKRGSEEYTNLELYVAWRGRGLPIETPSVRN